MKIKGANTPLIRPVLSQAYINALLERSRVVIAEAEAAIRRAEQWNRARCLLEEQEQARPSGGRVVPLLAWRGERRGR